MALFESDLNSEFKRYATFSGMETPQGVWPLQLAQAGFFRDPDGGPNEVVCFACGLKINLRSLNRESPKSVHQKLNPGCSFVSGSSNNHPVPSVECQNFPGYEWFSSFNSSSSSAFDRESDFYSLPIGIMESSNNDLAEDGGEEITSMSLPPINFSQIDSSAFYPMLSNLSTLEQSDNSSSMQTDGLPSDLINGFANANLQSSNLPSNFAHSFSTPNQLPSSDLHSCSFTNLQSNHGHHHATNGLSFSSSLLENASVDPVSRTLGEILGVGDEVADAESIAPEGSQPAPLMNESSISE